MSLAIETLRQMADEVTAAAKEHFGPLRDDLWRWSERLKWLYAREVAAAAAVDEEED